jgi:hypothetical protein
MAVMAYTPDLLSETGELNSQVLKWSINTHSERRSLKESRELLESTSFMQFDKETKSSFSFSFWNCLSKQDSQANLECSMRYACLQASPIPDTPRLTSG